PPSADALSNTPCRQRGFSRSRIIFDTVDGLASKLCGSGDHANAYGFPEHRLRILELLAAVAWLATPVGSPVPIRLRLRDASALRFLGGFRLGLRSRCDEGDERVTDSALHRVLGGTVERDAVDHRADDNAAPYELADRVADVLVVSAKSIDPPHDQRVAAA